MKNPIFFIFWLVVFVLLSFEIAFFCAFFYIIFYTLLVCFSGLSGVTDLLMQGIQFPHYCFKAMLECKSPC